MVDDMLNFGFVAAVAFCLMAFLLVMQSLPCLLAIRRSLRRSKPRSEGFTPPARVLLCLLGRIHFGIGVYEGSRRRTTQTTRS